MSRNFVVQVDGLYYVSFAIVVAGLVIYSKTYALTSLESFFSVLVLTNLRSDDPNTPLDRNARKRSYLSLHTSST